MHTRRGNNDQTRPRTVCCSPYAKTKTHRLFLFRSRQVTRVCRTNRYLPLRCCTATGSVLSRERVKTSAAPSRRRDCTRSHDRIYLRLTTRTCRRRSTMYPGCRGDTVAVRFVVIYTQCTQASPATTIRAHITFSRDGT